MGRESQKARQARAKLILDRLDVAMPDAKIELDYQSPLELLVAVMLSAQCTDKRVNLVTPALFSRFPTAEAYAQVTPADVEPYIRSCGLYRAKAKNLVAAARALLDDHGGQVPVRRETLAQLPGVGLKTAGVVASHLGGEAALPVDTHIKRLSVRLGLGRERDPDKVEADLVKLWPQERWLKAHQLLIWHGRRTCFARSPACGRCSVADLCPRFGIPD
ncbi:MAG TPA: endonuclease III [Myxococcaceae bacterium]|nr:endonuclease III [Myxococcaceae bacterium]